MNRRFLGNALGALSLLCLAFLWLGFFAPAQFDRLVRPHGLPIVLTLIAMAVILPAFAAYAASRRWLLVLAIAIGTAGYFLVGLTS